MDFSSINLSNFSLNPCKFSRSSCSEESHNLSLCCVKKQLSPYSTPVLLCTLTLWLFICPLAGFQKLGTCRSGFVQFLIVNEKASGSQSPSAFPHDAMALLSPLVPQTPLFQPRLSLILYLKHILSETLEEPWHVCDAWFLSTEVMPMPLIYLFMCPLIILYYGFSWFSWCRSQIHSSDRYTCKQAYSHRYSK